MYIYEYTYCVWDRTNIIYRPLYYYYYYYFTSLRYADTEWCSCKIIVQRCPTLLWYYNFILDTILDECHLFYYVTSRAGLCGLNFNFLLYLQIVSTQNRFFFWSVCLQNSNKLGGGGDKGTKISLLCIKRCRLEQIKYAMWSISNQYILKEPTDIKHNNISFVLLHTLINIKITYSGFRADWTE